jgi:hypothetical protein
MPHLVLLPQFQFGHQMVYAHSAASMKLDTFALDISGICTKLEKSGEAMGNIKATLGQGAK